MRKDARKGIFDAVLVWKLDRLSRSLKNLIIVLDEFGSLGIRFVSYNDGLDLTPEEGPVIFHFVAALAEFERVQIKRSLKSSVVGKRLQSPLPSLDQRPTETMRRELAMHNELLTVEEVSAHLKVPRSWIYQRIRKRTPDRLPHLKIGKYLRFELPAVQAWLSRHRREYQNLSTSGRDGE